MATQEKNTKETPNRQGEGTLAEPAHAERREMEDVYRQLDDTLSQLQDELIRMHNEDDIETEAAQGHASRLREHVNRLRPRDQG